MTETVLITGGAGFIGSKLTEKLSKKGYSVRILDNLSPQIHGENPEESELYLSTIGKADLIRGSVVDKNAWEKALAGADYLIHLAAETGTGQSMYEIEKYTDVNIKGTSVFLDMLANGKTNIKKVVVASSRAIYGEGKYICSKHHSVYPEERIERDLRAGDFECKCPICGQTVDLAATDEESKIHPTSIYGITKHVQESMMMVSCKSVNIPCVAFRYQNVYGPGQSLKNPYTGILSIFSTRIRNGNEINIFEDGLESRDFVYIEDVVDVTISGLENENANFQSFNVGSGRGVSVLNVAEELKKAYGSDVELVVSGNYRIGDIRHNIADLEKVKNKLGYVPKVDFEEGIARFANWVMSQKIEKDNYDASIENMREKGLYK